MLVMFTHVHMCAAVFEFKTFSSKEVLMNADEKEEPKSGSKRTAENPAASMPPPKLVPKPKKAPFPPPADQGKVEVSAKKMPKPKEEEKKDFEGHLRPEERTRMPAELISVELKQEQWALLSPYARSRILTERPALGEECFYCLSRGHKAYFCSRMLSLGQKLGKLCAQSEKSGQNRKEQIFCASCWWRHSTAAVKSGIALSSASGWYSHSPSTCNHCMPVGNR